MTTTASGKDMRAVAEKTTSGIPGLDSRIGGGFPAGRAILICGAAGTGKTAFGLQFLVEGLLRGEPGIFVAVDEKPRHLLADAASFGWDLSGPLHRGQMLILDPSPYFTATRRGTWTGTGIDARHVAGDLVQQVKKIGARRLVIDSLTSLVPPDMGRGQAHDYLRSLIQSWEDNLGCTIVLTCRGSRRDANGSCDAAQALTSGVIELRVRFQEGAAARTLRVRKLRGGPASLEEHRLELAPDTGLAIAGALQREHFGERLRGTQPATAATQPLSIVR